MGASDLRDAFNAVAAPFCTCAKATLGYERENGKEWQILTFYGNRSDGTAFVVASPRLGADIDVNVAAAAVAQKLLDDAKDVKP